MKSKLACIFLASGHSKRFSGNKLLHPLDGRPMLQVVLENLPGGLFHQVLVVTRYPQGEEIARQLGYIPIHNPDETDDISITIRLGLEGLEKDIQGCMFSVSDQPDLSPSSIAALVEEFSAHPDSIVALAHGGKRGNPVIFPKALFGELAALPSHQSGSAVIKAHPDLLLLVETGDERELRDIDFRRDLPQ